MNPLLLRPHHLLCLPLFAGAGYDQRFAAHMAAVRAALVRCPDTPVRLTAGADAICGVCPNRTENGCALGETDVRDKDTAVLRMLGAAAGTEQPWAAWMRLLRDRLEAEAFAACCGTCRWYGRPCGYPRLRTDIDQMIKEETACEGLS